ncbi:MAG TPA: Calx-beta domain-containing protein, partial [Actinomycetota bacterium]|nr:Calx-beta domain-containing protein [Actinomycetota bacterium]
LEASDDTNDSATDFRFGLPAPRNNAGAIGAAPGGALTFAGNDSVPELAETHQVVVRRAGSTTDLVGVNYETLDGSATEGLDYTSASGNTQWSDGNGADASFGVSILDDTEPEGPETIILQLRDPTGGAVLGAMPNATITIEANDDAIAPTSRIRKPRHRKAYAAKKVRQLTGIAIDADAGVAGVEVALLQRLKSGCAWWNGKRFTKRACSSPRWLAAKGAGSWRYRVSKLLPSSTGKIKHYELRVAGARSRRQRRDGVPGGAEQEPLRGQVAQRPSRRSALRWRMFSFSSSS